jgi:probable addiction module antidote protein
VKKSVSYQKLLIERLHKDEDLREDYLNAALEDENQRLILMALRNVAHATGGLTKLSKSTGLNRQNLYRTLSKGGNPTWQRIEKIFDGLGYPLRVFSQKILEGIRRQKALKLKFYPSLPLNNDFKNLFKSFGQQPE